MYEQNSIFMYLILGKLHIYTVKLGYNELAYNEHPLIVNKKIFLVGLGEFTTPFSWL